MIELKTESRIEVIDITSKVREKVRKSGIKEGIALVYSKHTTTAIVVNENESGLKTDILDMLKESIPAAAGYKHDQIDNNADAHLRAILLGNSIAIPVSEGDLELGTWQSILFIELDGPRRRRVGVKVIQA
jgi:secondary thiamine-phosphate synthase enzyme